MEFELIDTGIFDEDRYFDIEVEYAKADVERRPHADPRCITVVPKMRLIYLLPQAWFRNFWSWAPGCGKPTLKDQGDGPGAPRSTTSWASIPIPVRFGGSSAVLRQRDQFRHDYSERRPQGPFKDAFHDYVVHGRAEAVNHAGEGTKTAGLYRPHRASPRQHCHSRAATRGPSTARTLSSTSTRYSMPASPRDGCFLRRPAERISPTRTCACIQRQAFAGMLWSKQFYQFNVREWLDGDPLQPPPPESRKHGRNSGWRHLIAGRHHLDAGQMGISLVCRPGPRLPLCHAVIDRAGFRQGAASSPVRISADASQRRVAGLRMGVRRRQSARARLGGNAGLRERPQPDQAAAAI